MAYRQSSKCVEGIAEYSCHSGLAGTGIAEENEMILYPGLAAILHILLDITCNGSDLGLYILYPDILVKLRHYFIQALADELGAVHKFGAYLICICGQIEGGCTDILGASAGIVTVDAECCIRISLVIYKYSFQFFPCLLRQNAVFTLKNITGYADHALHCNIIGFKKIADRILRFRISFEESLKVIVTNYHHHRHLLIASPVSDITKHTVEFHYLGNFLCGTKTMSLIHYNHVRIRYDLILLKSFNPSLILHRLYDFRLGTIQYAHVRQRYGYGTRHRLLAGSRIAGNYEAQWKTPLHTAFATPVGSFFCLTHHLLQLFYNSIFIIESAQRTVLDIGSRMRVVGEFVAAPLAVSGYVAVLPAAFIAFHFLFSVCL